MPHVTMEYSANLDTELDMKSLCDEVLRTVLGSGLFEAGAPRIRAVRCEAYAIADNLPQNGFLDVVVKMGQGRAMEERRLLGEALFETLREATAHLLAKPHFALSLQIVEIDGAFSWKQNAIHPRLRSGAAGG